MLSPKQSNSLATPRKSAAATILSSQYRKRNRSPQTNLHCLPRIESQVFQMQGVEMVAHPPPPPPPPQEVGVFGVDAEKRINMWNTTAASITGAVFPKQSPLHDADSLTDTDTTVTEDNCNCQDDHCACDEESYDESNRRVFGMDFEDLFPSALFLISTGTTRETFITLVNVLDKVMQTGEPSMNVPVIRAGRKRGRDQITNAFSVDFLPQYQTSPTVLSFPTISGVVLVCKALLIDATSSTIISNSIVSLDKPRSLSAGSSGTCPTENETETETDVSLDREMETEIDESFRTCQIDASHHQANFIDSSFRTCQIDISNNTLKVSNKRLEALQAFDDSDQEDSSEDDNDNDAFFHLPSAPLLSPAPRIATKKISDEYNSNEDYQRLFETAESVIFGVDLHGTINQWNHKMEALTGIPRKDAKGRSLLEDKSLPFLPFQNDTQESKTLKSETQPILAKAFRGRSTQNFRFHLISTSTSGLSGSWETCPSSPSTGDLDEGDLINLRMLVATVSPRYNNQGEVVGALFLASDLTRYHMEFNSVKTDAHELRKLIDTANAPIFGIDKDG